MDAASRAATDQPADRLASLRAHFAEPRALSRPVPFWMLNDPHVLTAAEIERQLTEFQRQGVRVVVVYWAHLDVVPIYLQEPWQQVMLEICRTAERLGLTLWIGDECMCPSGSIAMQLPQDPRFRSVGLQCHRARVPSGSIRPVRMDYGF